MSTLKARSIVTSQIDATESLSRRAIYLDYHATSPVDPRVGEGHARRDDLGLREFV